MSIRGRFKKNLSVVVVIIALIIAVVLRLLQLPSWVVDAFRRLTMPRPDPRLPSWVADILVSAPWERETALCRGGRCGKHGESLELTADSFWTPSNDSITQEGLWWLFSSVAPKFEARDTATLAALSVQYLQRLDAAGGAGDADVGLVQIGPNVLHDGEVLLLKLANEALFKRAKLVLVEPMTPIIEDLNRSALGVGLGPDRTVVLNMAMCPTDDSNLTLWTFKPEAADPSQRDQITKWASLGGPQLIIDTWRRNSVFQQWPKEHCRENDLEDFLVATPVRCLTASSMLREAGMRASSVNFLFIDAEGYDAEILRSFIGLDGFDPAVIIFEYGFHHAGRGKLDVVVEVVNHFARLNYSIHKDNDNVVMFKL